MHRHYRRRRHIGRALAAAGALSALIVLPTTISAASSAAPRSKSPLQQGLDFYRGKTITIIEPGATGAIFDLIARTEATFLGQYLHATVNVEDVTIGTPSPDRTTPRGHRRTASRSAC